MRALLFLPLGSSCDWPRSTNKFLDDIILIKLRPLLVHSPHTPFGFPCNIYYGIPKDPSRPFLPFSVALAITEMSFTFVLSAINVTLPTTIHFLWLYPIFILSFPRDIPTIVPSKFRYTFIYYYHDLQSGDKQTGHWTLSLILMREIRE